MTGGQEDELGSGGMMSSFEEIDCVGGVPDVQVQVAQADWDRCTRPVVQQAGKCSKEMRCRVTSETVTEIGTDFRKTMTKVEGTI